VHEVRILLAAGLGLAGIAAMAALAWAYLDVPSLDDVPPTAVSLGKVSVIVAARDEARHIRAAVTALLAQDYPDYDVVVVDDRSTDGTGAILDELASTDARLRVVHVPELPAGWLGKNHAMHVGAGTATGDLLLFTDADVLFARDALSRAVRLFTASNADHLALAVDIHCPTWPLALVVNYFMMWFLLTLRAWRVRARESSAYVGIGAFNLVRATTYRAVGGHTSIRMRPDDDLMLGKLLKRSGAAQLLAAASGHVTVEWYRSVGELARGLRKNAFAGSHYSLAFVLGGIVANLALCIWPFAAVWLTAGAERAWYVAAVVPQMIGYVGTARAHHNRPWLALLYPVGAIVFVAIFAAAVTRTFARGGIEWRGTFYSLRDLRANRV
jgi:glycosyltransferase involved in cell wall biosynthesis